MSNYIFTPTVSGDFVEISSELSNSKIYLSNLIDYKCESLCNDLSNEINVLCNDLSIAINKAVTVSNDIDNLCCNILSVIKIRKADFDDLVVSEESLCGNTLYVVDSNYIDAYGQQLCNLTMADDPVQSYLGIAATKTYVDSITEAKTKDIQLQLENIKTAFNVAFSNLSNITTSSNLNDLLNATTEIIKVLSCFIN